MSSKRKLIYDFNEHGLYYDNAFSYRLITLVMGTIQLEFDYLTGKLFEVIGYIPLNHAKRSLIDIPAYSDGEFYLPTKDITYQKGVAYNYFKFCPISESHFMLDEYNPKITYDEINKRILLGTQDKNDIYTKINQNIVCGFDTNNNLRNLLILVDIVLAKNL